MGIALRPLGQFALVDNGLREALWNLIDHEHLTGVDAFSLGSCSLGSHVEGKQIALISHLFVSARLSDSC